MFEKKCKPLFAFFCVKPLTNTCSFTIIKLRKRTNVWNIDSFTKEDTGMKKGILVLLVLIANIKLRFFRPQSDAGHGRGGSGGQL